MSYRCNLCLVVHGLIGVSLLILNIDASADFTHNPPSLMYVVKGHTAKFVWTYSVVNKYKEFITFSPIWFYKDNSNEIGYDTKSDGWRFHLNNSTCPPRLLSPTIRVSREDQATLVITDVTIADSGVYGCTLDLIFGIDKTRTTTLIVTETPTFTTKPSIKTFLLEHSDLRILCTAVGLPTPNVTLIQSVTKKTLAKGIGIAILRISNVIRSQSGTEYECQAINNPIQGPVRTKTMVTVYYAPTIDLSSSTTNISSWNGNMVTIKCKYSSALPAPSWLWNRPNGDLITSNIHSIGDGSEMTVMTGQDGGDYGRYRCKTTNVVGSDEHSITVSQLFPPGPPQVFVTDKESTSVTIRWTKPLYNGGSPITGYKLVMDYKTFHINDTTKKYYSVDGLMQNTHYEGLFYLRNIAGHSTNTSIAFTTRRQERSSSQQESQGGTVAVAVCATFLVISLIVNILLVVYIYINKTTSKKTTDSGYNNKIVEMATVPSPVQTAKTSQSIAEYETVGQPNTKPAVPSKPAIYEIPGNTQTSQDHYQQLNPETIQHDPTVQYEPLRTKHATTDQRNDTYQPLRDRPKEYQSLHDHSSVNNSSMQQLSSSKILPANCM